MESLMETSGYDKDAIWEAFRKVFELCEISPANSKPADGKSISKTDINAAFKEEIQADLFYV